jgi:hypothetical protein
MNSILNMGEFIMLLTTNICSLGDIMNSLNLLSLVKLEKIHWRPNEIRSEIGSIPYQFF